MAGVAVDEVPRRFRTPRRLRFPGDFHSPENDVAAPASSPQSMISSKILSVCIRVRPWLK
jgi:hypothetical protein